MFFIYLFFPLFFCVQRSSFVLFPLCFVCGWTVGTVVVLSVLWHLFFAVILFCFLVFYCFSFFFLSYFPIHFSLFCLLYLVFSLSVCVVGIRFGCASSSHCCVKSLGDISFSWPFGKCSVPRFPALFSFLLFGIVGFVDFKCCWYGWKVVFLIFSALSYQ